MLRRETLRYLALIGTLVLVNIINIANTVFARRMLDASQSSLLESESRNRELCAFTADTIEATSTSTRALLLRLKQLHHLCPETHDDD